MGILAGIGGVLSGLGGLGGLLGMLGIGRKDIPMNNLNQYTDKTFNRFSNELNDSNSLFKDFMGSAAGSANKIGGVNSALERLFGDMGALQGPNVNEGFNLYNQRVNPIMDIGQKAATMFTQPYREKGEEVARRRASQASQQMMSQFGGAGFSGAASAAASGAASDVFSDYETNLAQMFGNIGADITKQGLGQERGFTERAPQQRFENSLNQMLQQAQLQKSIGSLLGTQGGLFGQLAGTQGVRSANLTNNIGALSRPVYQEQVQENPFAAFMQGLGGMGDMFSNPDFANLFKSS